jgi:uncharacterized protein YprB with RNaseH-like and TPR domain
MDPSTLVQRIRGVLGQPSAAPPLNRSRWEPSDPHVAARLGGVWTGAGGARFLVVERRWAPEHLHGGRQLQEIAADLRTVATERSPLCSHSGARSPWLFFDLETTGLSGGAGTLAFLVGCGGTDEQGGFWTRQYLLARVGDERALLETVASDLLAAGALVSFNGKSFDAPVLETRYLFHRLRWVGENLPHLDLLHFARRFWRDEAGCSLTTLERHVLGTGRTGDVPGFEIPGRYFQFLRDGDARPLGPVLEHNRQDLLSLAGLTARLARLVRVGPAAVRDAREALALGHLLRSAGDHLRAREAFVRASGDGTDPIVKSAALRALAVDARRRRSFDEAAAYWRQILDMRGCPAATAREATAALAVHHEHRARDLATAKAFALRSLDYDARPGWTRAVHHRLARLTRKMERAADAPLLEQGGASCLSALPRPLSSPLPPSSGSPTSGRRTSS